MALRRPASELLAAVAIVAASIWLFHDSPGSSDVEIWLGWMQNVETHGPIRGYVVNAADYPPGSIFTLWIVQTLATATGGDPQIWLKWTVFGFLLLTCLIVYLASRSALVATFTYAMLVVNALGLVYLDVFFAPFVVGAVWAALKHRLPLAAGLLAGACVMKWQPLIVVPFAFVYFVKQRPVHDDSVWRRDRRAALAVLAGIGLVVVGIFGLEVFDTFYAASRHGNLSNLGANALWVLSWVLQTLQPDQFGAIADSGLLAPLDASRRLRRGLTWVSVLVYIWILWRYRRRGGPGMDELLRYSLVGYLTYCMLCTGVHENHLFLASVLAIALAWLAPRQWWIAIVVSLGANLNLIAFFGWGGEGGLRGLVLGVDTTVWLAAANTVVFAAITYVVVSGSAGPPRSRSHSPA